VEWGRADHATFHRREVVFEINTNPMAQRVERPSDAIRMESRRIAFARLCGFLRELDWGDGTVIRYRRQKPIWRRLVENQRVRRKFTQFAS
jgi:hypothetical protein